PAGSRTCRFTCSWRRRAARRGSWVSSTSAWAGSQADVELTQLPRRAALRRQEHVNRQLRRTTLWRMAYARLESHLPVHMFLAPQGGTAR
ncbi:hypothetical protein, partial [Pseudomonas aeruginosa]